VSLHFPVWYLIFTGWLIILSGLSFLVIVTLWLLDRATRDLWKYLGIYNVVFDALWKHYSKKKEDGNDRSQTDQH
jgi:hypothetical protein